MKIHKAKTAYFTYCGRRHDKGNLPMATKDQFVTCALCLKALYDEKTAKYISERKEEKQ